MQLLDENGKFMRSLTTPSMREEDDSKGWLTADPTAQAHTVKIPDDVRCEGCTIRLMRQAREWSGGYRFWSCADVDIVRPRSLDAEEMCSFNGRWRAEAGQCNCARRFYGPRCQYEDECEDDSDCGNGQCVDVRATTAPRKRCVLKRFFSTPL